MTTIMTLVWITLYIERQASRGGETNTGVTDTSHSSTPVTLKDNPCEDCVYNGLPSLVWGSKVVHPAAHSVQGCDRVARGEVATPDSGVGEWVSSDAHHLHNGVCP